MDTYTRTYPYRRARRRRRVRRRGGAFPLLLIAVIFMLITVAVVQGREVPFPGVRSAHGASDTMSAPVKRSGDEVMAVLNEYANTSSDIDYVCRHAEDYPDTLLSALANNPEMAEFARYYPEAAEVSGGLSSGERSSTHPLLLQWDRRWGYASYGSSVVGLSGCGPTCLSMVVVALTGDTEATPDKVAAYSMANGFYVADQGTSWRLMTEGAAHYGLSSKELPLWESSIRQELDAAHMIICSVRAGDFTTEGHYIVIYGYDRDGLLINDPNSAARSGVSWDYGRIEGQISNLWAFSA